VDACRIARLRHRGHLRASPGRHAARLFYLTRHERASPPTTLCLADRIPMRQAAPRQRHTRPTALLLEHRAGGTQKLGSKYRRPEHENAVRALVARPASRAPRAPATKQHLSIMILLRVLRAACTTWQARAARIAHMPLPLHSFSVQAMCKGVT
jgi:hypothetical protein